MPYAERAFFDGDYCQHCADRDEFLRLQRIDHNARRVFRERRSYRRAA